MHEDTKVTDVEIKRNRSPDVEEIQNTDNEIHEIENEILAYGRGATTKDHLCECEHCGEIFTNSRSLWLHTKKGHKVKKRKNHSDLQESAAKKVLLDDEISIDKEVGSDKEENVTKLPTATYLDLDKDKEPKKNKKMNKKQKAEMLKGKKSKSRKGKKATTAKNACSDGELAENAAASNDDTGPVGKDKTKKANKDLKNIESESKTRQIRKESVLNVDSGEMKMSKESVVKESEYFSAHSQVKI